MGRTSEFPRDFLMRSGHRCARKARATVIPKPTIYALCDGRKACRDVDCGRLWQEWYEETCGSRYGGTGSQRKFEAEMKKLLLASSALMFAGPAFAADLPARMSVKAPVVAAVPYSWTGCYVGAHAGYGWGSTDFYDPFGNFTLVAGTTVRAKREGPHAGGFSSSVRGFSGRRFYRQNRSVWLDDRGGSRVGLREQLVRKVRIQPLRFRQPLGQFDRSVRRIRSDRRQAADRYGEGRHQLSLLVANPGGRGKVLTCRPTRSRSGRSSVRLVQDASCLILVRRSQAAAGYA